LAALAIALASGKTVRMERDTVRLSFLQMAGPDGADDPVTSLTIKWPVPLSNPSRSGTSSRS
jgi:hypothetical protein